MKTIFLVFVRKVQKSHLRTAFSLDTSPFRICCERRICRRRSRWVSSAARSASDDRRHRARFSLARLPTVVLRSGTTTVSASGFRWRAPSAYNCRRRCTPCRVSSAWKLAGNLQRPANKWVHVSKYKDLLINCETLPSFLRCDSMLVVFCLLFYFIIVCTVCVSTVHAPCATVAVLVTILVLLL